MIAELAPTSFDTLLVRHEVTGHFQSRPPVVCGVVFVTPDIARRWLLANTLNRLVKPGRVEMIARDVQKAAFLLNGETIVFTEIGRLSDGQTRLMGIVEANQPAWSVVVWGVADSSQRTVDSGVARSPGDVLHLEGEQNANDLATALLHVWLFEHRKYFGYSGGGSGATRADIEETLARHPDIRESLPWGRACKPILASRGLTVAAHYLFSRRDPGDAEYFFSRLADGQGLVRGDPILTLREVLIRDRTNKPAMAPRRRAAILVRAWNGYRAGEKLTRFQWTGQDQFPVPA